MALGLKPGHVAGERAMGVQVGTEGLVTSAWLTLGAGRD